MHCDGRRRRSAGASRQIRRPFSHSRCAEGNRVQVFDVPKTNVVFPVLPSPSIVAVPVTHDALLRRFPERDVVVQERSVNGRIQGREVIVDRLQNFDHVFADELDYKGRNPTLLAGDNPPKVSPPRTKPS